MPQPNYIFLSHMYSKKNIPTKSCSARPDVIRVNMFYV